MLLPLPRCINKPRCTSKIPTENVGDVCRIPTNLIPFLSRLVRVCIYRQYITFIHIVSYVITHSHNVLFSQAVMQFEVQHSAYMEHILWGCGCLACVYFNCQMTYAPVPEKKVGMIESKVKWIACVLPKNVNSHIEQFMLIFWMNRCLGVYQELFLNTHGLSKWPFIPYFRHTSIDYG
jgi:hypothetical protein